MTIGLTEDNYVINKFTLIELMVVVAIIAMLITLLLPALHKAKEVARTSACTSNLRQIGFGIQQYLNDNDGYFPHSKWSYSVSGGVDNMRWQSYIQEYLGIDGPYYQLTSAGRDNQFYCPNTEKNNSVWYSYQINRSVCPSRSTVGGTDTYSTFGAFRINKIKKLSRTLLTTDGKPGHEFIDSLRLSDPHLPNSTVSYRHRNGAVVLFVDGHTQWMKPTTVDSFPLGGFTVLDVAFQNSAFPGKPLYE